MEKRYPFFVEDYETPLAELGQGFIQNYISSGDLSKAFAVVSERRVYFKGELYRKVKGRWKKGMEEKTVDLKDITGTGYESLRQLWLLILAICSPLYVIAIQWADGSIAYGLRNNCLAEQMLHPVWIIMFLIFVGIFLFLYFTKRKTIFRIEFAGGEIACPVSWYSKETVDKFQMDLRKAMANVKDKEPTVTVEVTPQVVQSVSSTSQTVAGQAKDKADALREYAKLKEEGVITEEEFQKMKLELFK